MYKNVIKTISVIIIILLQILFLAMILKEKSTTAPDNLLQIALIAFMTIILGVLLLVHRKFDFHAEEPLFESVLVAVWVPLGALLCFFLSIRFGWSKVIAAGTIGTAASFIPLLNRKSAYLKHLPIAFYCGAFVGMTSAGVANSWHFVLFAGSFTGLLLIFSKSLFVGIGGKLGTLAFAGVVATSLIYFLVKKYV